MVFLCEIIFLFDINRRITAVSQIFGAASVFRVM